LEQKLTSTIIYDNILIEILPRKGFRMNHHHFFRLVQMMYDVPSCPALDKYGTRIFERPIHGTWKLFRHIARTAIADTWQWDPQEELAAYPQVDVPTFEEFATFMLHEVTHGWCYFHNDQPHSFRYPTGIDEEQVCWDVSRLVCAHLGIIYQDESAKRSHRFHQLVQAGDMDELEKLMNELPAHHQLVSPPKGSS
jgi:hypothetical protein